MFFSSKVKIITVVLSVTIIVSSFVSSAMAATEMCDCWCGKDKQGAQSFGSANPDACPSLCNDNKLTYITCTNERLAKPPMNIACWTKDDCEVKDDKGNQLGVWNDTYGEPIPAECAKSPAFGNEMRYCYSPPTEIKLGVSLGGVDSVKDISEYLNALYAWLLYATVIAAAVMIMVGGVEYMIGAGVEKIQKAKSRIIQALVGFAILVLIEVILSTVNPAITEMNFPHVKKIKQVAFVEDETACERLLEHGFMLEFEGRKLQIPPGTTVSAAALASYGKCGSVSPVIEGVGGSLATIEECNWVSCDDINDGCFFGQDRSQAPQCLSCLDIKQGAGSGVPTPSAEVCHSIEYETIRPGEPNAVHRKCFLSEAPGRTPQCVLNAISCDQVTSCRGYDDTFAYMTETHGIYLECLRETGLSVLTETALKGVCADDPCKVAPSGQTCMYVHTSGDHAMFGSYIQAAQADCVNSDWYRTGCLTKTGGGVRSGFPPPGPLTSCLDKEDCFL